MSKNIKSSKEMRKFDLKLSQLSNLPILFGVIIWSSNLGKIAPMDYTIRGMNILIEGFLPSWINLFQWIPEYFPTELIVGIVVFLLTLSNIVRIFNKQ